MQLERKEENVQVPRDERSTGRTLLRNESEPNYIRKRMQGYMDKG